MPKPAPRIFRPTPHNLARLAAMLRSGEIVGVPSETVYGLAADALNPAACAKIFAAKGRPTTDPLIVHLASLRELEKVAIPNAAALALAKACWPGPLTLVLPKRSCIPNLVTAGKETVAVRIPDHPLFRKLIRLSGCPLAAPSANPFGYISPTTAAHVRDSLAGSSLRAVLDGGECPVGVESTIIDLTQPNKPRLLRPGGVPIEKIETTLGRRVIRPSPTAARIAPGVAAPAPGMLAQHYSPHTPLILHARIDEALLAKISHKSSIILLRRPISKRVGIEKNAVSFPSAQIHWLSENGSFNEIARNLFTTLRRLDAQHWEHIHAEVPNGTEGLAPAIRDRLTRAAAKRGLNT